MHGSPRGLRGWQRGHRPSGPDPGNAGGGKVDRKAQLRRDRRWRRGHRALLRLARRPARSADRWCSTEAEPPAGRDPRRRRDAGAGRRADLRRARAAGDDPGRRRGSTRLRRRAGGGERDGDRLRAPGRPARRPRPRRGGGAAPRPRPAALARPRGRVAAAAPLPRARAGPDAVLQRRRPRARRGGGRPAGADRGAAGGARRRGVEVRTGAEVAEALLEGERLAGVRTGGRRGAAGRRGRPRRRRLVGPGRVAARARPPAGAPGQGPDPRAARPRRRRRPASGSSPPSASTWCRAPTAA